MELVKASNTPFDPRGQMADIFAEGFYDQGLKFLSRDKARLARALAHMFILEGFYLAVEGETVLGIVGAAQKKPPPIKLDKGILVRELGFFRGRLAFWGLNRFCVNHPYPFVMDEKTASIEFVATSPAHRGKGVASQLVAHVMADFGFDHYVLEVIDTNPGAISVYEKLGFREFMRKPSPAPKRSGFNYFIYMRRA